MPFRDDLDTALEDGGSIFSEASGEHKGEEGRRGEPQSSGVSKRNLYFLSLFWIAK